VRNGSSEAREKRGPHDFERGIRLDGLAKRYPSGFYPVSVFQGVWMKIVFIAVIAGLITSSGAFAQSRTVYKYNSDTIDSSIKCELSQVAKLLQPSKPDPSRMFATISVSGEETITRKVGGSFFGIGGSVQQEGGRLRGASGRRNINVDNRINCRKSFIVDVGVLSCFQEQQRLFLDGQTITCAETSTGTSGVKAGGKFDLFTVGAEVGGEWTSKRVWKIEIKAPPG
jgi:hypothetical protein